MTVPQGWGHWDSDRPGHSVGVTAELGLHSNLFTRSGISSWADRGLGRGLGLQKSVWKESTWFGGGCVARQEVEWHRLVVVAEAVAPGVPREQATLRSRQSTGAGWAETRPGCGVGGWHRRQRTGRPQWGRSRQAWEGEGEALAPTGSCQSPGARSHAKPHSHHC